ncbi:MAG: hypothetical protein ACLP1W_18890 [Rhodomicrobium sp.]
MKSSPGSLSATTDAKPQTSTAIGRIEWYESANAKTASALGNLSNWSLAHLEPVSGGLLRWFRHAPATNRRRIV